MTVMIDLRGSSANTENLLRIHSRPANRLKETVYLCMCTPHKCLCTCTPYAHLCVCTSHAYSKCFSIYIISNSQNLNVKLKLSLNHPLVTNYYKQEDAYRPRQYPFGGVSTRHPPGSRSPQTRCPLTRHPPDQVSPCCKACWDTTCNACWDTTPPCEQNDRQV